MFIYLMIGTAFEDLPMVASSYFVNIGSFFHMLKRFTANKNTCKLIYMLASRCTVLYWREC